jgi:hypothetical protein
VYYPLLIPTDNPKRPKIQEYEGGPIIDVNPWYWPDRFLPTTTQEDIDKYNSNPDPSK